MHRNTRHRTVVYTTLSLSGIQNPRVLLHSTNLHPISSISIVPCSSSSFYTILALASNESPTRYPQVCISSSHHRCPPLFCSKNRTFFRTKATPKTLTAVHESTNNHPRLPSSATSLSLSLSLSRLGVEVEVEVEVEVGAEVEVEVEVGVGEHFNVPTGSYFNILSGR